MTRQGVNVFPQTSVAGAAKNNMARGNGDIVTCAGEARAEGGTAAKWVDVCVRRALCCAVFSFLGWRLKSHSLSVPLSGSCHRPGEHVG